MPSSHDDLASSPGWFSAGINGIRGMDVTEEELRGAGRMLEKIVRERLEDLTDDEQQIEKGALAEMLLALGIGDELTVRGEIARRRWMRDMEETCPGSYAQKMIA